MNLYRIASREAITGFFMLFLCFYNYSLANSQDEMNLVREQKAQQKGNPNQATLDYIRYLFSIYPAIKLPFSCKIQGDSTHVTEIYTDNEKDTLVFGNSDIVSIIGIVPDTSNYFCIFYMIHADDVLPAVVIFDKKGKKMTERTLGESCWQGGESDCATIVTVSPDLKIVSDYSEFLYEEQGDEGYSDYPSSASGYVEYAEINKVGKIVVSKRTIKTKEELFKDPIIHE